MNDTVNEVEDVDDDLQMPDELTMLKQRATLMGIKFSNNIGVESLKARIQEQLNGEAKDQESDEEVQDEDAPVVETSPIPEPTKKETQAEFRARLRKDAKKLVRIRITCLDPKKANLPGEILTVANEYIGTVRRYVPYGEKTDQGWHVEQVLFDFLKGRKFLQIKQIKGQNGKPDTQTWEWVREFAIEVLDPLTPAELAKLRATQAAAGGIED